MRQGSPESPFIFDFIMDVHRACSGDWCQNLALMANCGDCCILLFCGRESLACRVPYCQAGYIREWLQLLI